jgi:hypothetical protein
MRCLARLLTVIALLVVAPPAMAASDLATGIADDAALLNEPNDARAAATVAAWAALGIDDVRIFAQWERIAPASGATQAPAGFNGADPNSPGYDWSRLDRAVNLVSAAGMRPLLVVTGPGPLWASQVPGRHRPRYKPRPDLFGQFARAAALRYAAAVDRYVIWNEPNLPLWLQPQATCKSRRCIPYAPHLYRRLARAAYPAIKLVDPSATVLFGALAPKGENPRAANAKTRPLAFIRSMGCVKLTLRRDRSGPCKGFKPLTGDGFAYHPHAVFRAPDAQQPELDEASLGDLPRLKRTLDGTQRAGGFVKPGGGRFNLYFTEWGYETRPPDKVRGVSLAKQSRWLQQGAYMAWGDPRVKLLTQYEWRDEALGRGGKAATSISGWQSGLRFANDAAKPSLATFANPFFLGQRRGSRRIVLWGQVRPGVSHRITVQRRKIGTQAWTPLRILSTDGNGYWSLALTPRTRAEFRFTWQPENEYGAPAGPLRASDVLRMRRR